MQARTARTQSGFTLLELVIVLVLASTLGVGLYLHWTPAGASLNAQAGQLARVLRHTQALALTQGRRLTFDVQSTSTYAISDAGTVITDPQGLTQSYSLVNNVTLAGGDLDFDGLGRPVDSGGNLISSPRTWTLSADGASAAVSVAPLSGFVTVTP